MSQPVLQPTSAPSGIYVAPSVPADINSFLTSAPTIGNHPLDYDTKEAIQQDDIFAMNSSRVIFLGIVVLVLSLVAIYYYRR